MANVVEYIDDQVALVRRGKNADEKPEKAVQRLMDLKLDENNPDYIERQLRPLLMRCGRYFKSDRTYVLDTSSRTFSGLVATGDVSMLGMSDSDTTATSSSDGLAQVYVPLDSDCFLVNIGHDSNSSVMSVVSAVKYLLDLGAVADGVSDRHVDLGGITFPSYLGIENRSHSISAPYGFFDDHVCNGQAVRGHMFGSLEYDGETGSFFFDDLASLALKEPHVADDGRVSYTDYPDDVTNKLAANLLLQVIYAETDLRRARYVLSLPERKLVDSDESSIIDAAYELITDGGIGTCAMCGKPVIGRSKFCRTGRCRQKYWEKADELLEKGVDPNDVYIRFPALPLTTLKEKYRYMNPGGDAR